MKVLFIPLRASNCHLTTKLYMEKPFPYYVPSYRMFSNDYASLNLNIIQTFLEVSEFNINQHFHLIPDDLFIQFEETELWDWKIGNKRLNSCLFQYHIHQNGADVWTLENHYQYQYREPIRLISSLPRINPHHKMNSFYHGDDISICDDGKYIYLFNPNQTIKKIKLFNVNDSMNYIKYMICNNQVHIYFMKTMNQYEKWAVSPLGHLFYFGMSKHWNPDYFLLASDPEWHWHPKLDDYSNIKIAFYKFIKYQEHKILFFSCFLKNYYDKKFYIYALLPPNFNEEISTIEQWNSLWDTYIYPQNKWKMSQWVKKLTSQNPPPLGFFEYQV